VSTCRFGARAKLIKNKEKKNVVRSVAELEGLVAKEEAKRAVLKRQLQALLQLLEKHNLDPKDAGVDPMSVKLLEQALAQDAPPGLGGGGRGGGGVGGPGAGAASHAGGYSAAAAVAPKTAEELEEEREEAVRVSAEIKKLTGMIGSKTERLTQVRALLSEVSAAVDGLEATHSAIRGLQDEMEARHFREQEDLFAAGDLKLELETLQQENDTIKAGAVLTRWAYA
jgi:hypothetical protein